MSVLKPAHGALLASVFVALPTAFADNHGDPASNEPILHVYELIFQHRPLPNGQPGQVNPADKAAEMIIAGQIRVLVKEVVEDEGVTIIAPGESMTTPPPADECKQGKFKWAITGFAIPVSHNLIHLQLELSAVSVAAGNVVCSFQAGGNGPVKFDPGTMDVDDLDLKEIVQQALESI